MFFHSSKYLCTPFLAEARPAVPPSAVPSPLRPRFPPSPPLCTSWLSNSTDSLRIYRVSWYIAWIEDARGRRAEKEEGLDLQSRPSQLLDPSLSIPASLSVPASQEEEPAASSRLVLKAPSLTNQKERGGNTGSENQNRTGQAEDSRAFLGGNSISRNRS